MNQILFYAQIIVSVALIALIVLQEALLCVPVLAEEAKFTPQKEALKRKFITPPLF